jgi:hypothetical protein
VEILADASQAVGSDWVALRYAIGLAVAEVIGLIALFTFPSGLRRHGIDRPAWAVGGAFIGIMLGTAAGGVLGGAVGAALGATVGTGAGGLAGLWLLRQLLRSV